MEENGIDCDNYRGISLLSTSYKIFSNIHLPRMTPYANEIVGEYQCGFRSNRSTVDHIFSIRQILEKKWEYNKDVLTTNICLLLPCPCSVDTFNPLVDTIKTSCALQ